MGQKYQALLCDLVLLLGGTPLGIFAPNRTITSNGRLLLSVRKGPRSTVRAHPYYSNVFTVVSTVVRADDLCVQYILHSDVNVTSFVS
jgi:hypothetical protein